MRVLFCHRVNEARDGQRCVATVDVELNEDVRLCGLRLLRMPDGKHFIYAPQAGQRRTATFSKPMAEKLTGLALAAYEAHDAAA